MYVHKLFGYCGSGKMEFSWLALSTGRSYSLFRGILFVPILFTTAVIVQNEKVGWDRLMDIDKGSTEPEQVHLSWDGDASHMTVTWNTPDKCQSVVQYGLQADNFTDKQTGDVSKFVDTGNARRTQYVHRTVMKNLLLRTAYHYRVGNEEVWSKVFKFTSLQDGPNWSPKLAVFGDMGLVNARSLKRLTKDVRLGRIDMIIHVGDFAYDMNEDEGRVGDAFMRMIEPLAAHVPYQTVVGNHEYFANFTQYKSRFTMPGSENGLMYRFAIGPANFVVFSTEFYFYLRFGIRQIGRQYSWLESELKKLNDPEIRKSTPWIITLGHRPMYCSNGDQDDCTKHESVIRTGLPVVHWYPLEKLFYGAGVDMCIWAHEHSYERLWPVYDRQVFNGSNLSNPYDNPKAPVHIITGSAGNREKTDTFINPAPWSAFRNADYGYMKMHILNSTHIQVKQISDEKGGNIIDEMTLVKDAKRKFGYKPL